MCGIVAIVGPCADREEKLTTSLSRLAHRGDNPPEYRILDGAALGADRLAIVDAGHGRQPQTNEDETVFAIQNGQIFNFQDLAARLMALGHRLRTRNDTEVLAHLWEEYRERMLAEIDSEMFAFVIYDTRTGDCFAARDPVGLKPLYYGRDRNGCLYIASELKGLTCFDDLIELHEFPAGHYFLNGRFTAYAGFDIEPVSTASPAELAHCLERAVMKRVQTELPIAVFLSGGVDSSLIMEIATRFHNNVTALILGDPQSSDYVHAVELCRVKNWRRAVCPVETDFIDRLPDLIYFLESYEPNIVRHSYANDTLSRFAHDLGFKIVLTGEGADEVFAGYKEFLSLSPDKVNSGCRLLLKSMSAGNAMRVDKMAMRHTIETRCPFFDQDFMALALPLPASAKIGQREGKDFTKFLLREIALDYLPGNIAFREKVPFANGAGLDIGLNYKTSDGVLSRIAEDKISDTNLLNVQKAFPDYKFTTKEEALFFQQYCAFDYDRLAEGNQRLIVKDTLLAI